MCIWCHSCCYFLYILVTLQSLTLSTFLRRASMKEQMRYTRLFLQHMWYQCSWLYKICLEKNHMVLFGTKLDSLNLYGNWPFHGNFGGKHKLYFTSLFHHFWCLQFMCFLTWTKPSWIFHMVPVLHESRRAVWFSLLTFLNSDSDGDCPLRAGRTYKFAAADRVRGLVVELCGSGRPPFHVSVSHNLDMKLLQLATYMRVC
jgi:hypothetical protein